MLNEGRPFEINSENPYSIKPQRSFLSRIFGK